MCELFGIGIILDVFEATRSAALLNSRQSPKNHFFDLEILDHKFGSISIQYNLIHLIFIESVQRLVQYFSLS
jgi:hypothetical protein